MSKKRISKKQLRKNALREKRNESSVFIVPSAGETKANTDAEVEFFRALFGLLCLVSIMLLIGLMFLLWTRDDGTKASIADGPVLPFVDNILFTSLDVDPSAPSQVEAYHAYTVHYTSSSDSVYDTLKELPQCETSEAFAILAEPYADKLASALDMTQLFSAAVIPEEITDSSQYAVVQAEVDDWTAQIYFDMSGAQEISLQGHMDSVAAADTDWEHVANMFSSVIGVEIDTQDLDSMYLLAKARATEGGVLSIIFVPAEDSSVQMQIQLTVQMFGSEEEHWSFVCYRTASYGTGAE